MPKKKNAIPSVPLTTSIPEPIDHEYRDYAEQIDRQLQTVAGVALWYLTQHFDDDAFRELRREYQRWLEDPNRAPNIERIAMQGPRGAGGAEEAKEVSVIARIGPGGVVWGP